MNELLSQPSDKIEEFVDLTPTEAPAGEDSDEDIEKAQAAAQEELRQQLMKSAQGALKYLKGFFDDIKVPFAYAVRADIESSFQTAKDSRKDSQLFQDYMDSQYAKSYQHFANILLIAEEEAKSKPKAEDAKMEESSVPAQSAGPSEKSEEKKEPANSVDQLT